MGVTRPKKASGVQSGDTASPPLNLDGASLQTVVELSVLTKLLHCVAGHGGPGGREEERRLLPGVSRVPMLKARRLCANPRHDGGTAVSCDSDTTDIHV